VRSRRKETENLVKKKIRAIQYGVGPIGASIARLMHEKQAIEIISAIDTDPAKVARDLGEVVGAQDAPWGVKISGDAKEVLEQAADVVIHSTSSSLPKVMDQLLMCLEAESCIVSTCEELSYPYRTYPELAAKLDAAAKYLDLSEAELRSRLNDGKTLAQIAKDQGKTVDGLVNALVKDASDRIDAAVASGKLTKSQADDLEAGLKERMTDLVESKLRFAHHVDFRAPGPAFRGFRRPDFMPDFRFRGFDRAPRRGQSA